MVMESSLIFPLWVWIALGCGLVLTGALAGVLAGLLGVGGGIVIVPVLSWILALISFPGDISQQVAVGTSLATIIPTAMSSTRAHQARGAVDTTTVQRWAGAIVLGALAGSISARFVGGDALKLVFGFVAFAVAVNLTIPRTLTLGHELPRGFAVQPIAFAIGTISALMGIGGGTLAVPVQTAFDVPIRRAVGTSSAFGLLIAIPGTLGFIWAGLGRAGLPPLSLGFVSLPAAALLVPATWLCAPYGARLAHSVDQVLLRRIFAGFLAVTATRMLWSVFL